MYKRRKINNEDSNNNCMSKLTSLHPNYGKVGSSSKVVDYLNDFALANFLGSLEDGKYGSVTKEYEALHAQRMQVINFLSTLRPSVASRTSQSGISTCSDPSSRQNQINSDGCGDNLSRDIIDLDVDTAADASSPIRILAKQTQVADNNISPHANASGSVMHKKKSDATIGPLDSSPVTKEDKEHTAVIVLDSDEEDACQAGSRYASHSEHEFSDFRASLTSQIQKHMLQTSKLAQEISFNQLVPYDQVNSKSHCGVTFKPNWQPSVIYEKVVLQTVHEKQRFQDVVNENYLEMRAERQDAVAPNTETNKYPNAEMNMKKEDDVNPKFVSSIDVEENSSSMGIFYENEKESSQGDGLEDLWKDMSLAMEYSKSDTSDEQEVVQQEEECNHSYLLRDDYGLVCRICGVIQKSIDTIFDYQWMKVSRATRTYLSGSQNSKDLDETQYSGLKVLEDDFIAAEVSIHPRHLKQMKPHQLEGFNFLVKNLVTDKPGGCILAHAPGSGKTFMLISFIQSFLALYPSKKPLVVLPKGILPVWKQEFQRWQVEDFPIYDFYSSKADNRSQQLEVLKLWQENKSILFLGYKQFSNIIYDKENSKVSAACREILLKIPSLLILDEGHTPRNKDTYILDSLAKVQTPRKVVLSGTLFQNHVREVFTILDLVHPKFLRMESSRAIVKRVLSRVHISGGRKLSKDGVENAFFDLVEETLQNDKNFKRKVTVIQDLRELTKDILHYYKGDFLEELPGLVDFTVLLNLSPKQKLIVQKLAKFEKFKKTSVGSAVYIHPHLYDTAEKASGDRGASFKDDKIDSLLETINVKDGVKTKFFLNILSLSESTGEKLLAFSQYILPLKFLERLVVKTKGWHLGKEIFMISGDTNPEERTWSMEQFNKSPDAKVFFGSIKACGEGISLVGASRVVMLDVHLNPSVTRQAIGRAFRPGQLKKVYTYRLVAADSPEEVHHYTSFSKDLISKMWFEWSEYCGHQAFELDEVNMDSCEDLFLESPIIGEDIKGVYRR